MYTFPHRVYGSDDPLVSYIFAVRSLCKLIGGEFPVKHCSDYIGLSDKKAFSVSKPKLSKNISRKILLKVNVVIGCQGVLSTLKKVISNSIHFIVICSGLGFPSSMQARVLKWLGHSNWLHLDEVLVSSGLADASQSPLKLPGLTANGTLWLNTDSVVSVDLYTAFLSKFVDRPVPVQLVVTQVKGNLFAALISQKTQISSFSLLCNQQSVKSIGDSSNIFGEFLRVNSNHLEYFQVQHFLTLLPLSSLQKCINLRVLSVTANTDAGVYHPAGATQVFRTLESLHQLEYFEWSEPLNLLTKDVLVLHNLLLNYLPRLLHWHWNLCNLLVFTTDLSLNHWKLF